jgi:protein SOK2
LPPMSTALVQPYQVPHVMDTTGQVPPPGMRPRLTTSIFEEEGSLCFQVDVNGICVARREGTSPR